MHKLFRTKAYEHKYGPHFNEEWARKAVSKMHNEDGSRGPHWTIEETTLLANQYGVNLNGAFNRYDWYVALNMIYSDFYKVILSIANSNNNKHFVEFAKAWLNDKDIDEGKMWYYFIYVMCDYIREEEMDYYEDDNEDEEYEPISKYRMSRYKMRKDYDGYDDDYEEPRRRGSIRYVRY